MRTSQLLLDGLCWRVENVIAREVGDRSPFLNWLAFAGFFLDR